MKKLTVFLTFALLLIAEAYAQSPRTVTGKVTDDKGTPLSGVTISAVGVNKNALSDNNGSFSIQVAEKVKTLKKESTNTSREPIVNLKKYNAMYTQLPMKKRVAN